MPDEPGIFRFGVFEVHLATGELRRNGGRVKLQEQPFQVLAALLERPGEVVTKEELKERLWAGDTFVDFDHSLSTAVNKIRDALGDSASNPRFVETVPRRGYRFVGFGAAAIDGGPHYGSGKPIGRSEAAKPRWWLWGLAAAGLAALLGSFLLRRPVDPLTGSALRAVPLTSFPGREIFPAFSPDGTRVAFSWDGEDGSNFDIYVQVIGAGAPVRLTMDPSDDLDPTWSPDGRYLAFARKTSPDRATLLRISALGGGQESVITEIADSSVLAAIGNHYVAWSPSGDAVIFPDRRAKGKPLALYRYELDSGQRVQLTEPPEGFQGDTSPSLSADAKMVVFVRYSFPSQATIRVLELDSEGMARGESREVVSEPFFAFGPVFLPHSQEVVFSMWAPLPSLWRVPVSGNGPPVRLAGIGERGVSPSFSEDGKTLAYSSRQWEHDIWRLELSAPGVAAGAPERWIYSTHDEMHANYSPDGTKIAFQSDRSGEHQIWVCDADGSNPERLTELEASFGGGSPRWSPDQNQIAFDSNASGRWDIYVMNANGSGIRRLTRGNVPGHSPYWSPDGEWIYFSEAAGVARGLWRIPSRGGEPQMIAENSIGKPRVSSDGRYVYHRKGDRSLWRVSSDGGEEEILGSISSFAVVPEGIYYTPSGPILAGGDILFHSLADRSTKTVWHSPDSAPDRFSISGDGRYLLFTLPQDVGNDLMIVENFR